MSEQTFEEIQAAIDATRNRRAFVYVAQRPGELALVKIGRTADLRTRMRSIGGGVRVLLAAETTYRASQIIEQAAHDALATRRTDGEWFAVSPLRAMRAVLAAQKRCDGFMKVAGEKVIRSPKARK